MEKVSKNDMVRVSGSGTDYDGQIGAVVQPGIYFSNVKLPALGGEIVSFHNNYLTPYEEGQDYTKPRPMDVAASLKGDDRPAPNGDEFEAQMLEVLAHGCKPTEFPSWWVSAVKAIERRDAKRQAVREQKGA